MDEQLETQIHELEDMAAQVYAPLAHRRADALRLRIRELVEEAEQNGIRVMARVVNEARKEGFEEGVMKGSWMP